MSFSAFNTYSPERTWLAGPLFNSKRIVPLALKVISGACRPW
jgi:hypothetical protein